MSGLGVIDHVVELEVRRGNQGAAAFVRLGHLLVEERRALLASCPGEPRPEGCPRRSPRTPWRASLLAAPRTRSMLSDDTMIVRREYKS